jgi:hypothetical protein
MSRVIARPRDVCRGMDPVVVCWVKRRWACEEVQCPRQTFTESVPHLRPRCRITTRLREQAGAEVAGRGSPWPRRPRHAGVSWPVAHEAFAAAADPVLDKPHAPVTHLGVDEHRRSRPQWEINPETGPARPISAPSGSASPDRAPDPPRQAVHRRPHHTRPSRRRSSQLTPDDREEVTRCNRKPEQITSQSVKERSRPAKPRLYYCSYSAG